MSVDPKLDFEKVFGEGNVIRLSENRRNDLGISNEALLFLSDSGLPHQYEELSLKFSLTLDKTPLSNSVLNEFLLLGTEYDAALEKIYKKLGISENETVYSYMGTSKNSQSDLNMRS